MKSHCFTSEEKQKIWLCGCKQTKNPPYCDGSHTRL
jgi:CDGSH-type Zn-finger protein